MSLTYCRACGAGGLTPLWADYGGFQWHRCGGCGSDSSEAPYNPAIYDAGYLTGALANTGGFDAARAQVRSNIEWYAHHAPPGRDFLDVGCLEGAGLAEAAAQGWRVHGWDCIPAAAREGCTTISPHFTAALFPRQYHAVFCKDVIEHVPGWRGFLAELAAVTAPGGLLQVQTPTPMATNHPDAYQPAHLVVLAPGVLESEARRHGLVPLDRRLWGPTEADPGRGGGQAWLFRR
jgi:SAM-dependent methyltransferase